MSDSVQMLCNRLAKNEKRLAKWRKQQQINAYRCYDADIPEFAAAVDIYDVMEGKRYAVVQEYTAPKTVDAAKAQARLETIVEAVQSHYQLPPESVFVKARQRQKGAQQYEKLSDNKGQEWLIQEGAARLRVNLSDYLDTGVFLDHRPMRRYVHQNCRNKSVLNLFCYTASVSVHAALGGASDTLSIDMSNTYLDWARRNFLTNKLAKQAHRLKREDCLAWLAHAASVRSKKYDLIFLDPPSFSNSKKMESVLDIQRDHVTLIRQCMAILRNSGQLIFSNNLRSFKLDEEALHHFKITPYHRPSIDPDFERNPRIHQCYLISKK